MKTRYLAIYIVLTFGSLAFLSKTQAVSPAPDGCYPNFTTAEGCDALSLLTTGAGNTGLGWRSLFSDSTGSFNTGVGAGTLVLNTADSNTAVGAAALLLNTTGTLNTAVGTDALVNNDSGSFNNAVGSFALFSNVGGVDNTAIGHNALPDNVSGGANTAVGNQSLFSNTDGGVNTGVGFDALFSNDTGNNNTAVGAAALAGNTTGASNIALGHNAGLGVTTGNNIIAIGPVDGVSTGLGQVDDSCYIGNIHGQPFDPAGSPAFVMVDADGKLGTVMSSRRFKKDIRPMDRASEGLLALKPVTFHYNHDKKDTPQFGLIAEEVAEVSPDLVTRDKEGKLYSVRYDQVNAMLLNEFLKAHQKLEEHDRKSQEQQATITELKKEIAGLTFALKEQAAQIQKVSAQVEVSRSSQQVVRMP